MKIVYMGTPDFAVPALQKLAASGHQLALVVTKADRPKDRGKKLQSCTVKLKALELGLKVESPERLKGNDGFLNILKEIAPDLIVVAAYGKILPVSILSVPKYGCINIHGSLLPEYRGAAPIHRAVINGEPETGVTLMYMAEGMDTGDMIAKASTAVGEKTTGQLYEELAEMGAELLMEYIPMIEAGTAPRIKQDDSLASYAPMVFKEEGIIDFNKTAREICCLVRGFNSWPTASTIYNGQVMKVHMAKEGSMEKAGNPGTVASVSKKGIEVFCMDGTVFLTNIQLPGKKAMEVSAFLAGNRIEEGTVLG